MTTNIKAAVSEYDRGAERAVLVQSDLWRGKSVTPLADEIRKLLGITTQLSPTQRGFLDCVEEMLTA